MASDAGSAAAGNTTSCKRPAASCSESGEPSSRSSEPWSKRPNLSGEALAAVPASSASCEISQAAPKLAEAIRSAAKCVKVAEKASLFEEGRATLSNASAMFSILSAAAEDPTRWRQASMRLAFRRLFNAAATRLNVFALQQQQSIKVWQFRIVTQIDLLSANPKQFAEGSLEVDKLLRRLPCADPADEPRSSAQPGYSHLMTGPARNHLPEHTRASWCLALFECLEVAVRRFKGPQLWVRAEVNHHVKLAAQRRQNFTRAQQEVLEGWETQRRAHWATAKMEQAKAAGLMP